MEKSIHFIVEASWLSGEEEENEEKMRKRNRMLAMLNEALLNLSAQSLSVKVVESRPFVLTADTWSVPSYDLVWGSGHFYAGATIGVTTFAQEQQVIRVTFDRHNDHILKSTNKCSDCVTVSTVLVLGFEVSQIQLLRPFTLFALTFLCGWRLTVVIFSEQLRRGDIATLLLTKRKHCLTWLQARQSPLKMVPQLIQKKKMKISTTIFIIPMFPIFRTRKILFLQSISAKM